MLCFPNELRMNEHEPARSICDVYNHAKDPDSEIAMFESVLIHISCCCCVIKISPGKSDQPLFPESAKLTYLNLSFNIKK